MITEISEIKTMRKRMGLTQTQLAQRAQVSQSLIAKIESGNIDPTYSKARKIFDTLDQIQQKNELKASDLMQGKIVSLHPDDEIKEALKKMKKFEISQMPVIDEHKVIGMVSEADLLEALLENKKEPKIVDIMEPSPPVLPESTSITIISNLLRHYSMILVSKGGQLIGVITKRDLLDKMIRN